MTGVPVGPGPGKSPKDRNEFPMGPYRIDVDRDSPQIRQKAERAAQTVNTLAFSSAYQISGTEEGVALYTAEVVTYDLPSRTGTAILEGVNINFTNVTKLTAAPGDIIIISQLTDGTYIMIGRLSQAGDTIGGSFPSGTLPTGYPWDTTIGSYPIRYHGNLGVGQFIVDRANQMGFGLETVAGNPNATTISVNGFVLSTGGNFTLGTPPAPLTSGTLPLGQSGGYVIVFDGANYVIWDPASGWSTAGTTGLPAGSMHVDLSTETVWIIGREATTNYPRIHSFFGGVLTDHGRMGLPATQVVTFITASNGLFYVRTNTTGDIYGKTTTGTDNFVLVSPTTPAPSGGLRLASADGNYIYSIQQIPNVVGARADFFELNLNNGSETAYYDVLPERCYAHGIIEGASGGLVFVCAEQTNNFPDGGAALADDACVAIYGFDGANTIELFHDVNIGTDAGTNWHGSASNFTRVLGTCRIDGELFFYYATSTGGATPGEGVFLRFDNI